MNFKIAAAFLATNLVLPLGLVLPAEAESPPINGAGAAQEYFLAVSLPSKDRLALMSYAPITMGGEVFGGLAAYDDITTARPGDYLELYNKAGDLLAVSWFDGFGIERLAVDRALVEDAGQLQGIFVLLISGHSA